MSYMSKSETFRTEEMRMNNQLDKAAEKHSKKEDDFPIPEEEDIPEDYFEDFDPDEDEDDWKTDMIEERGIDADNGNFY